jgi:hypothetical protein
MTVARAVPLASVNIAALVLALTATALRCFVRIRLLRAFGTDDWLMVAAAVRSRVPFFSLQSVSPMLIRCHCVIGVLCLLLFLLPLRHRQRDRPACVGAHQRSQRNG